MKNIGLYKRRLYKNIAIPILCMAVLLVSIIPSLSFAEQTVYVVQSGDTLRRIADRFEVDLYELAELNNIENVNLIFPGQRLTIPLKEDAEPDEEEPAVEEPKPDEEEPKPPEEEQEQPEADEPAVLPEEEPTQRTDDFLMSDPKAPLISITMVNTPIKDVLSVLALKLNKQLIYVGPNQLVTYAVDDVTPQKAFHLFLSLAEPAGETLSYLEDGDLLIVGPVDKLNRSFFHQIELATFTLRHLSADELSRQLSVLGLSLTDFYFDHASHVLFVQGTPYELAKVAQVISVLDKSEYFPSKDVPDDQARQSVFLTRIDLRYITATDLVQIANHLQIGVDMITLQQNPRSVWIHGPASAIVDFREVKNMLDIAANAPPTSERVTPTTEAPKIYYVSLDHVEYDMIASIIQGLDFSLTVLPLRDNPKRLIVYARPTEMTEFSELLQNLDRTYATDKLVFFIYTLHHITAEYAAQRIDLLQLSDVRAYPLAYPFALTKFSREVLVVCADHRREHVRQLVGRLDVPGTTIRVPIDHSDIQTGRENLLRRRDLLVQLTNIPMTQFFVSQNVARNEGFHFILYMDGTPDQIQYAKDMIDAIDRPGE